MNELKAEIEMSEKTPKCIVFSDIRGDYRLLVTLLTQITKVAKFEKGKWSWKVKDTTVICMGNFTDRYGEVGYNRLLIPTHDAINEERKIINTFLELENDKTNQLVVLMGDHELGNILHWPDHEIYQMAKPDNVLDREAREEFINDTLKPFCTHHGLMVSWGVPGGSVVFSRGCLERSWLKKYKSIRELNRAWRKALQTNDWIQLKKLGERNSPIMSTKQSVKPQLWRQQDEDAIIAFVGEDPKPRFVQSVVPIQVLESESWDPNIKSADRTMLISMDASGTDQMYYIHNCMADVFCNYEPDQRQPQALQFELKINNFGEALYMNSKLLRMEDDEFAIYQNEIAHFTCPKPQTEDIDIPDEVIAQLIPEIEDTLTPAFEDNPNHIKNVGLLLFSHDMKSVLLLKAEQTGTTKDGFWNIPMGHVGRKESLWASLSHHVRHQTGLKAIHSDWKGGTVDYRDSYRVWIRQVGNRNEMSINPAKAEWVSYDHVFSNRVNHVTGNLLCFLAKNRFIPYTPSMQKFCPSWARPQKIPPRHMTETEESNWDDVDWDKQIQKWEDGVESIGRSYQKTKANVKQKWKNYLAEREEKDKRDLERWRQERKNAPPGTYSSSSSNVWGDVGAGLIEGFFRALLSGY